jgi:hypothetical protein
MPGQKIARRNRGQVVDVHNEHVVPPVVQFAHRPDVADWFGLDDVASRPPKHCAMLLPRSARYASIAGSLLEMTPTTSRIGRMEQADEIVRRPRDFDERFVSGSVGRSHAL